MNIADLVILRQLLLLRVQAGYIENIDQLYLAINEEITEAITSSRELTEYQGLRLQSAINDITAQIIIERPDLTELGVIEAQAAVNNLIAVGIEATLPKRSTLERIAKSTFIAGNTFEEWFGQLELGTKQRIDRQIKLGVTMGLTNAEITKSIVGLRRDGDRGSEVLKISRRDAVNITRTGVITVSNEAALSVYRENDDVLKGVEHVATLDSRTCIECGTRDGTVWDLDGNYISGNNVPFMSPAVHISCRCALVPVTKSFEELGINQADLPAGTRASQFGQVSESMTFEAFMNRQGKDFAERTLGVGRYQLYKDKKLTINDLLNPRTFKPMTLAELQAKYN